MKTFKNLKFKPHTTGEGLAGKLFFKNGYGVSVVRFKMPFAGNVLEDATLKMSKIFSDNKATIDNEYGSYTNSESEWELAVLKGKEGDWEIDYNTPITSDVIGHLKDDGVTEIMKKVQQLPKANNNQ